MSETPRKPSQPTPIRELVGEALLEYRHRLPRRLGLDIRSHPTLYHSAVSLQAMENEPDYALSTQFEEEKRTFASLLLAIAARDYNLFAVSEHDGEKDESTITLGALLRDDSDILTLQLPETSKLLRALSSRYFGDRQSLQSFMRQSFWDHALGRGLYEMLQRPYNRTKTTDAIQGLDRKHLIALGCARAEYASKREDLGLVTRELCNDIVDHLAPCFYTGESPSSKDGRKLYHELVDCLRDNP